MADDATGGGDTGTPDSGAGDAGKTFTQAELDRIVGERVARESKKYEGFDEIRQKADRLDQLEDQQKTELQKAQDRADRAERKAADKTSAADKRLIQAAVLAEATRQKAIKPEHLHKLLEADQVTVGDDGQVTGAEDAVKSFLEANPEYVGSTRPNGFADQGARSGGGLPTKGSFDDVIRERAGR